MFSLKKNYYLIIESIKDFDISTIKKRNKFTIIYRNFGKEEDHSELNRFRRRCKLKSIKFIVANNFRLAVTLRSDGIYLSAHNLMFKALYLKKFRFEIIGSAHNINEIVQKKRQGCEKILLSKLFLVDYKKNSKFLEINKFNNYILKYPELVPLGGIKYTNLNKLKLVKSNSFAILSEIKKKPAKIINRLF